MGAAVTKRVEDAGVDLSNGAHVVAVSLPGAVVYFVANSLLTRFVYRPAGFRICGLADVPGAPDVVAVKFPAWASSFVSHGFMWAMWWKYIKETNGMAWIADVRKWHAHNMPVGRKPDDGRVHEKKAIGPYYIMYFSYVWNACYKDMLKSAGRKGGSQQMLFDLHHVLTVGLLAASINWGTFRAGMLTRLIHDPADIVLYACKMRQAFYETRGGPASALNPWWAVLLSTWFFTRIGLYGHLCRELSRFDQFDEGERVGHFKVQMVGCWAMCILQVAFFKGISETAINFVKTGGIIDDPFHGKTTI